MPLSTLALFTSLRYVKAPGTFDKMPHASGEQDQFQPMPDGTKIGLNGAQKVFTAPNLVTFGRLCAVPLAFWAVIERRLDLAFYIFVAAGLSDAVDGWLARRLGGNSVGALLDPLADKALLVTMYITLAAVRDLPDWLAILVVFRDLLIIGGVIVLGVLGQPVTIQPLYVSKLNTTLQIVLIAVTLCLAGFGLSAPVLLSSLIWLVATSTLISGAAYVWGAARGG